MVKMKINTENNVNKDLQDERNKVHFNVEEFTNWFYGGADKVKEKRYIENYFLSNKDLNLDFDTSYLSYKDKYEEAVKKSVIVYKNVKKLHEELGGSRDDFIKIMNNLKYTMGAINPEGNPILLHFSMFALTVLNMGNDEQVAEWAPRVLNCNILGTYAQTELGHGTYLQKLETTATYDEKSKEFVINSPTITAYKWWPGNLGHTVNYAVVMAQLYSKGQCHGIQPFLVQLRDEETHKPLPGIDVGDIGNKVGFQTVNNGFLGFKNVRIPLKNMLMKNSQLLEDGTFIKAKSAKSNYGTMVFIRVFIVMDAAVRMTKACTIALRYSMVRRQSPIEPDQPEPKIIEHITQQNKIFPGLAKALIFKCMADYLTQLHSSILEEENSGNLARMPELHALICGLKAVCTDEDTRIVEVCRRSCGGHGFLRSAGLSDIYKNSTAAQTYEGENTVMLLQSARFLIKSFNEARKGGNLTEGVAYLSDYIKRNGKREVFDDSISGMLRAIKAAAAGKISSTWRNIENNKKYYSPEQSTNLEGVQLTRAAELHAYVCLLQVGIQEIGKAVTTVSPSLGIVLNNILELFAIDTVLSLAGDILLHVDMSNDDIEKLHKRIGKLFEFFRTSAIGIVDGFDFSDAVLDSTLGSYNGNVYENLFKAARKSPLNQEDVNKSFHLYLKPFMKSSL